MIVSLDVIIISSSIIVINMIIIIIITIVIIIIEDASARPPHPKEDCPADGVAQCVLRVYDWFLAKPSCSLQAYREDLAFDFRSILGEICIDF